MKYLKELVLEDEFSITDDLFGYCREIDRYMFMSVMPHIAEYYVFHFMTEEQFRYFRDHREELEQDQERYRQEFNEAGLMVNTAGAEYIRLYHCAPGFCSTEDSPLPSRWGGPYWYDGERLLWDFYSNGRHYGVPVIDIILRKKIGDCRSIERLKEEGFEYRYFNDDENYGFYGKECIENA